MRFPALLPPPVPLLLVVATLAGAERGDQRGSPGDGSMEVEEFLDDINPHPPDRSVATSEVGFHFVPLSGHDLEKSGPAPTPEQAPAPSPYASVSHGSESLQLVEESQFRAAQEELDQVLAGSAQELEKSLLSMYHESTQNLRGEMQNMIGVVKLLHLDSESRVDLLAQRERRLELTLMHGQYGKCCCSPSRECSWSLGQMLLGPYTKLCDRDKKAYTEFLGTADSGLKEDEMLDMCVHDKGWLSFTTNQVVNECQVESRKLARDLANLDAYVQ